MKKIFLTIFIVCICISVSFAAKDITFSHVYDISNIPEIERTATGNAYIGESVNHQFYSVSPSELTVYKTKGDFDYISLSNSNTTGTPGSPCLPMKTMTIELPDDIEVSEITLTHGKYREIKEKLNIVPLPEPNLLGSRTNIENQIMPDPRVYSHNDFYPKNFVSFDSGSDGKKTIVFVRIFPVQYNPVTQKTILLVHADIEIAYQKKSTNKVFNTPLETDAENIIICPDSLQSAAEQLQDFHTNEEGILSDVITTEWIAENYEQAPDPDFPGYAEEQPDFIEGYDYALAKKIINFLGDESSHPDLISVTLMGDAELVPPSYYYFEPTLIPSSTGWSEWEPSDFLYSSPDYDLVPNYEIGRISINDSTEAVHVIDRIMNWHEEIDWAWFSNVVLAGNDPFVSPVYFEEMFMSYTINEEYLSGCNIQKCFDTDGNYTHDTFMSYLNEGENGFFWISGHGGVTSASYLDVDDLLGIPEQTHTPIIISTACKAATFDIDLISEINAEMSFGEAVLKSDGAGIAFMGGPRPNTGSAIYYVDNGNQVITKILNMAEIQTEIFHAFNDSSTRLGQLHRGSITNFVENNDMYSHPFLLWTLFGSTLLGDPALQIPTQVSGTNYDTPTSTAQQPTYINSSGYPVYHLSNDEEVIISSDTNSPSVTFKLTHSEGGSVLEIIEDNSPPFEYTFQHESPIHNYILRTITEDEKEGWFHFYTTTGNIITDGDSTDWSISEIEPVAVDSIDFETPELEVTDLYVTNDEYYWYFAFTCTADTTDMAFGIAIDCIDGGYTGVEGVDQDAMGNWITFDEEKGVDFEIYFKHGDHDHFKAWLYEWQDSLWVQHSTISPYWDKGYDTDQNFVEVKVPTSSLYDPESMDIILFSTPFSPDGHPAQDSSPSDSATYHTIHYGQENANTLSNFATITSTSVEDKPPVNQVPTMAVLHQNYPNPFNPITTITYTLPEKTAVTLNIYDITGKLVTTLVDAPQPRGYHTVQWNGTDYTGDAMPSGVYFYRLHTDNGYEKTRKMLLLK